MRLTCYSLRHRHARLGRGTRLARCALLRWTSRSCAARAQGGCRLGAWRQAAARLALASQPRGGQWRCTCCYRALLTDTFMRLTHLHSAAAQQTLCYHKGKSKVAWTKYIAKADVSFTFGATRMKARYLWWQARLPLAAPHGMQACQQGPGPHLLLTPAAGPPWTGRRPCTVAPAHESLHAMRASCVIQVQARRAASA